MSPTNASEMKVSDNIGILLKGPFGGGKTITACSMAVEGPIYLAYFDKDQPVELLDFFKSRYPKLLKNISFDVYSGHNPHEYLNFLIKLKKEGCPYYGIITDSVTFFTSAAVNWSLNFRNRKVSNAGEPNIIPEWDEYKIETSLIAQCLDITMSLPCVNIWTGHPLPNLQLTGRDGSVTTVQKTTSLVSYGNKVGAMVPGRFTEIYHCDKEVDYSRSPSETKRFILTEGLGDQFAKTSLGMPKRIDFQNGLFWEQWLKAFKERQETLNRREIQNDALANIKSAAKV